MVTDSVEFGATIPWFGRTRYRRGWVVLTLKAMWFLVVPGCFKVITQRAVPSGLESEESDRVRTNWRDVSGETTRAWLRSDILLVLYLDKCSKVKERI